MVDKSTFTQPTFIDNGTVDWRPVVTAFHEIQTILNEHADELKGTVRHNTQTISFAIEGNGITTILKGGKHYRGKITNAFVTMGDNIQNKTSVELVGISEPINFNTTEGAGKVRIFKLTKSNLHFIDEVKVNQIGDRRMIVNMTIESTEEGI